MVNILIYIMIFMLAVIFVFLFFIMANHYLSWHREKTYQRNKESWEVILYNYLAGELTLDEAKEKINGNYNYLWEFIKPYLTNLKGEDRKKVILLAQETGLRDYFFKKISSNRRKERIMAASALGKLGEKEVIPYLKGMLDSSDTSEMTFAAKAIADLGETSLITDVFKRMLTDTYTTYEGISEIAVRFGVDICPPLQQIIQKWLDGKIHLEESFGVSREQSLSLIIDILGYYRFTEAAPELERVLINYSEEDDSKANEVIIHIFKALTRLEYPVTLSLTPFLLHGDWIIKSQAARYIGKIGDSYYKDEIKKLLEDENWWVRYYAAKTLYKLGEITYLYSISKSKDVKGEMSRYILSMG